MARVKVEENIQYDDERKLYYVTLSRGKDITGKRVRETKTFSSKREAVKYRNEHKDDAKDASWQVASRNTSLEEYGKYFFENCLSGKSPTTLYGYTQIWDNHIIPAFGQMPIGKITPQHVSRYYTQARTTKKLSGNTLRKHHHLLNLIFNRAIKEGVVRASPMSSVESPQVEKKESAAYTAQQLVVLLDEAKKTKIYVAVMLASHLGLRRGEICGLKWESVDLENRIVSIAATMTQAGSTVIIKDTKTKNSLRKLHINDDLHQILLDERAYQNEQKKILGVEYNDYGYVFCWEDGLPYRPNYLSDRFTHLITVNSLPTLTLHGLRHTWVSLGIDEGVPTHIISRNAGHSSQAVTDQIYAHKLRDVDERPTTAILAALERARQNKGDI